MIPDNVNNNNSGSGNTSGNNTTQQQQTSHQGSREGDYKNIETAVNNPSYFDDDYAVKQEEEFVHDDKPRDDDNRVGRGTGEG